MKNYLTIFSVALCAHFVHTVVQNGPCINPPSQAFFDVAAYVGRWYELQRYEQEFQTDGECVTAEYSLDDSGMVKVVNTMIVDPDTDDRRIIQMEGNAVIAYPDVAPHPAMLNVSFHGTTDRMNYLVLATDYDNFSIVWSCVDRNDDDNDDDDDDNSGEDDNNTSVLSAWILSRSRQPTPDIVALIDQTIETFLDKSKLRATVQNVDACAGGGEMVSDYRHPAARRNSPFSD